MFSEDQHSTKEGWSRDSNPEFKNEADVVTTSPPRLPNEVKTAFHRFARNIENPPVSEVPPPFTQKKDLELPIDFVRLWQSTAFVQKKLLNLLWHSFLALRCHKIAQK